MLLFLEFGKSSAVDRNAVSIMKIPFILFEFCLQNLMKIHFISVAVIQIINTFIITCIIIIQRIRLRRHLIKCTLALV